MLVHSRTSDSGEERRLPSRRGNLVLESKWEEKGVPLRGDPAWCVGPKQSERPGKGKSVSEQNVEGVSMGEA